MDLCRIIGALALTYALTGLAAAQPTDRSPDDEPAARRTVAPYQRAPRSGAFEDEDPGAPRARRSDRDGQRYGGDAPRWRALGEGYPDAGPASPYERSPEPYPGRHAAPAPYERAGQDGRSGPPSGRAGAVDGHVRPTEVGFAGADGEPLQGLLFRPQGAGPFPAVVALHGCTGLYSRSGELNPRHADWGERLAAQGFLVLMPDSFGSRGLGPQCGTSSREIRPGRERVADAVAAKAYLQGRRDVRPEAVSLLGWSNGGSTVLYAARAGLRDSAGGPPFAHAVAFYPGCRLPAERGWEAGVPLLILIGEADDWTPADACRAMVEAARRRGEPVDIKVYAGAYHDFDHPDLPLRERHNLAYTANGDGAAHVGTDPAARADALRRVPAFLAGEGAARSGTPHR